MRRLALACFASAVALLVGVTAFAVPQAHALGAYSIDELSTHVTVETNATTHVVERQTLTFADNNAGVVWYLHAPEEGESVRIANVSAVPVDDGGTPLGNGTRLQMIDSDPDHQGHNPGDTAAAQLRTTKTRPWYSYSIGDGMMRCYFPTGTMAASTAISEDDVPESEITAHRTYAIEVDYTISHRVRTYRDIAELYWRYVNDNLPTDARNVSLQVTLPLPADADPLAASGEITAWGHGPADGTFAVGQDGSVTYRIDHIAQGNYAEAHLIFPADWMTNLPASRVNQFSELRRSVAEAEEAQWVDIKQREAAWDAKVRMMFLAMAMAVALVALVSAIRHGRSPHTRRTLIRAAATLAIVALGAQLFFHEPVTTIALFIFAAAFGIAALAFPIGEPGEGEPGGNRSLKEPTQPPQPEAFS